MCVLFHFGILVFDDEVTKIRKYYIILLCLFVYYFSFLSCLSCLANGKHRTENHATYFCIFLTSSTKTKNEKWNEWNTCYFLADIYLILHTLNWYFTTKVMLLHMCWPHYGKMCFTYQFFVEHFLWFDWLWCWHFSDWYA